MQYEEISHILYAERAHKGATGVCQPFFVTLRKFQLTKI